MTICYYATSHGYGHAIRTSQVIKALPVREGLRLMIRTLAPETIFREELARPFEYCPAEFDCGCLQSDSVTVLPRETLDRYAAISARSYATLDDEVALLRREGVTVVVCDIPSFPLLAASRAGIPGVAISNFTWHEIYEEYAASDADRDLLATMAREYATAAVALVTPLGTPGILQRFPRIEHIPIIARKGVAVRERINAFLGPRVTPHIAMLYVGLWGLDVAWNAVERLQGWTFFTYEDVPGRAANVVTIPRREWPPADVAASVDAVVSKPGYGTITECMANSVPLVYIPRAQFAEYAGLVDGMDRWGGAVQLSTDAFSRGDWSASLAAALASTPDPTAFDTTGASVAARHIMEVANAGFAR